MRAMLHEGRHGSQTRYGRPLRTRPPGSAPARTVAEWVALHGPVPKLPPAPDGRRPDVGSPHGPDRMPGGFHDAWERIG
ncbi:MAG: hypothetical protein HY323_07120 [Betaproteobacteria bacterium]|nr:hypothetical protein [Betaproteobacteria bacterium]